MGAWPYRAEYAAATVAILAVVFGWRLIILHEPPDTAVLLFVLFFLLPDIVALVPIGLSRSPRGTWPAWGPPLYNVMHSLLTWLAVFLVARVLTGRIVWRFFGWAAHITRDRAVGYHLRARSVATLPSSERQSIQG
ncbi:MAG: DUF4260 family protein [Thermoplasmata archaeon]